MRNIKTNPYFMVRVKDGIYSTDNTVSYYRKKLPDETLSFDTSNQKVQANIDEFGTVKNLTFFHGNYRMESKPGVWVGKDFVQENDLSVTVSWNGKKTELKSDKHDVVTDLADNIFPRSVHQFDWGKITVIAVAPIEHTGTRISSLMYGIIIENQSEQAGKGVLGLPSLYKEKYSDTRNVLIGCRQKTDDREISFVLLPDEKKEFMLAFTDPDKYMDTEKLFEKSIDEWLCETEEYLKGCIGKLSFKDNEMAGYLVERAYQQAFGAFAMNAGGQLLGSNWGTYPVTPHVWNKDMYYSGLPFTMTEPDLCKKTILWFEKYGIKYPGTKFKGGVLHSLSNSVSVILLSGAYYDYFNDSDFFLENKNLFQNMKKIINEIIASRDEAEPHLYRSIWISDAYALGKYHTGSNICVFRACMALARIAQEVFGENAFAQKLYEEAMLVQRDIEKYMTIADDNGKRIFLEGISTLNASDKEMMSDSIYRKEMLDQGLQFLTDVDCNGTINLRMHDGEESDTTLLKYYGYMGCEENRTINYGQFSGSKRNPTYSELSRGIKWGNQSGATFPGYISVLNGACDYENFWGENGRFTELLRLADLDGSFWWWPYKVDAKTSDVTRMNSCGKCGWGSGLFYILLITEFLGIKYDAPGRMLTIVPKYFIGDFSWKDFHIGNAIFDITKRTEEGKNKITVLNKNSFAVNVNYIEFQEGEYHEFVV